MRKAIIVIRTLLKIPERLFSKSSVFAFIYKSVIHRTSAVLFGSKVYWSEIERFTFIGNNCFVIHATIGSFCSISDKVMIGGGKHPLNFVSTSPVFYSKRNVLKKCFSKIDFEEYDKTIIGNDVWIGLNAFIRGGVRIGHGSVVGAHAVVTKDVEPYSIVVGNPAKMVRKRFDDATIDKLLKTKWWDLKEELLASRADKFQQVEEFLDSAREQYNNSKE